MDDSELGDYPAQQFEEAEITEVELDEISNGFVGKSRGKHSVLRKIEFCEIACAKFRFVGARSQKDGTFCRATT